MGPVESDGAELLCLAQAEPLERVQAGVVQPVQAAEAMVRALALFADRGTDTCQSLQKVALGVGHGAQTVNCLWRIGDFGLIETREFIEGSHQLFQLGIKKFFGIGHFSGWDVASRME